MFKIISLNENSYSLEMYYLLLDKTATVVRKFDSEFDVVPDLRGEFLNYLIHETYAFAARCYSINQAQKGIENAMLSVETYFLWAVIKKDENGYSWPPVERIMTEWIKVRAWLKVMLPKENHASYSQLKNILKNMNEMNEMFLAQFKNKGIISTIEKQTV